MYAPGRSGAAITGTARCEREAAMGQWLIADISFSDIHVQLWMVLVVSILLLWFIVIWATRKAR